MHTHFTVTCPRCEAAIGQPCVTKAGNKTSTHSARRIAADAQEIGHNSIPEIRIAEPETIEIHIPQMVEDAPVIPQPFEIKPKMVLHVISGGQKRVFWDGGQIYDMSTQFKNHELRAYLEMYCPTDYAVISEDDLDKALALLEDGYEDTGKFNGEFLTGFVKGGDGATVIMTPKGSKVTLSDLKIISRIHSPKEVGKFMKYLKRLFAMYRHAVRGTDQIFAKDNVSDVLIYKAEGKAWKIRYDSPLPMKFSVEGCGYITPEWANGHLGLNPDTKKPWKVGDTARITFTCREFMWKGHVICKRMKNIDATFSDTKKVIGTEDVFVGFMGTLHAGQLHMGVQEYVDWNLGWAGEILAQKAIESYGDEMNKPDFAQKAFDRMWADKDQEDADVKSKIDAWRFMSAHKNGFQFHQEPFMQRDAYRAFQQNVLDVSRGRVPVPADWGFRAYYFIDPWCINDDGVFDYKLAKLKGNCVYSPKLANGVKIVTFRNPHTIHEYVVTYNVAPPKRYRVRDDGSEQEILFDQISDQVMIVSVDCAMAFAEVQGGGDYDDCGNIYFHPSIVAHFVHNLPSYPAKLPPPAKRPDAREALATNKLAARYGLRPNHEYNKKAVADAIRNVRDADAGIGMIDNYLRHLMTISVHSEAIMADLERQLTEAEEGSDTHTRIQEVIDWLLDWAENKLYSENKIASALEDAIDACAMNGAKGSVDSNLGQEIRDFWAHCPLVFYWETLVGKSGFTKIPGRCLDNNPVVVMDPLSHSIKAMEAMVAELDELVKIKQWMGLPLAPRAIRAYPSTREVVKAVNNGWKHWKSSVRTIWDNPSNVKLAYKSFIALCEKHLASLESKDNQFQMMFMAELERRIYDGPYGAPKMFEGEVLPVPDAYLNNPKFFPFRVKLYKELGLNGLNPDVTEIPETHDVTETHETPASEILSQVAEMEVPVMPEPPIEIYDFV